MYYYLGLASYYQADYKRTIFFLRESIWQNPNHQDTYNFLSQSFKAEGNERMSAKMMARGHLLKDKTDPFKNMGDTIQLQVY